MIWVRGAPEDFDTWAYLGADGWSWDDVRPVYERLEVEFDLLTAFEPDAIHAAVSVNNGGRFTRVGIRY